MVPITLLFLLYTWTSNSIGKSVAKIVAITHQLKIIKNSNATMGEGGMRNNFTFPKMKDLYDKEAALGDCISRVQRLAFKSEHIRSSRDCGQCAATLRRTSYNSTYGRPTLVRSLPKANEGYPINMYKFIITNIIAEGKAYLY